MTERDAAILRPLARRLAELAASDANRAKAALWSRLTDLDTTVRPLLLVHLWPLAWSEVLPDETTLACETETGRSYERQLRQQIWSVENLTDDTILEPVIRYPHCVTTDPYGGLQVRRRYADHDRQETGAAAFEPVIVDKSDIEKIGAPVIHVDETRRERHRAEAEDVFGAILDVIPHTIYMAAKVVDELSWLRGIDRLYLDMVDDPGWTHEALQRMTDNFASRFRQCEQLGVWGPWEKSAPLGSTGLRLNPDLPSYDEAMRRGSLTLADTWGFTTAEAFTSVSPTMHDEFSFTYDRQLLGLFRHVNVGCCEVLSDRIELIRTLPNVRRISISEWADLEQAAAAIGTDYVYGYKPSGVPFIMPEWNPEAVRSEIRNVLDRSSGCVVEIILNIGGSLGPNAAQKLRDWSRVAMEEIERRQART